MFRKFLIPLFFNIVAPVLLTACAASPEAERPTVTVSIAPLQYATQAVCGEAFHIETLTPAGASPETYQPTPRQIATLSESSAYIRVGTLGFERTQLKKITDNTPHLLCVEASFGIPRLAHSHEGHDHEGGDPHTWMSPANMKIIAANICNTMSAIDTAGRHTFAANLRHFTQRMDSLDTALRTRLANAPSRTFLIYHPALAYFAQAYGLRQLSVQTDGKEPSPEQLAHLIDLCRREQVRTVFVQKEYSGRTARTIAEDIGAEVVEINPLSADWEAEINRIADALCP